MSAEMKVTPLKEDFADTWLIKVAINKATLGIKCRETDWQFGSSFTGQMDHINRQFWIKLPKGDLFAFKAKLQESHFYKFIATVNFNDQIFGMHFDIICVDEEGICCAFPDKTYEVNRRQSVRYKIPQNLQSRVALELITPKFSFKPIYLFLLDVSVHGIGFKVPEKYASLFAKEQIIPVANIRLDGKVITASIQIKNMFPTQDPAFPYKVGARFIKIDTTYQIAINQFISQQVC